MLSYSVYKNDNTSKWVTFIHGAGGSSSIWFRQIRSFKEKFNILLIDLSGHGKSKSRFSENSKEAYTFELITGDIVKVLNNLSIEKSHFVGVSLGTIIVRDIADRFPNLVESLVLAGAILKFNIRSNMLMIFGNFLRSVVPYILLYKLEAFIIMPKKNHRESRLLLIKECRKLNQKEFIRWCKLTRGIKKVLKSQRLIDIKIPSLYIMGAEDSIFLPSVKKAVLSFTKAQLSVIESSGHVVNVDQPVKFNDRVIKFLKSLELESSN
jgi:pimeloyl-ACP methyl ester carboxylesterase